MPDTIHIVSSQFKLHSKYSEGEIASRAIDSGTALRNDPFSFQVFYKSEKAMTPVSIAVTCDGLPIEAWRVDSVPLHDAANRLCEPGYVDDGPGIYPDILMPRPNAPELEFIDATPGAQWFEINVENLLNATSGNYQSLWVTVNADGELLSPGTYILKISMTELLKGEVLAESEFSLTVIDAVLPEQDVYYTNWFYEDTLCDFFNVPLYSEEFYRIFDEFLCNAVRHRQNTLLLPAFTPPLDTIVGRERRNVQLVKIRKNGADWQFDFTKMKEFVNHAKACGIRYFEHCHLFSQWGAEHTPNIYDENGVRIFGYDTNAVGEEYQSFLHAYLEAFFRFAKEEHIYGSLVFHISDEPKPEHLESYRKAYESVAEALKDHPTADAMSHPEFYTEGLVKQPIPFLDKTPEFEATGASFWVYYTSGPHHARCSNRLISNTAARTRVLGVQMYRYNALGFLHWGYNYYYDRLSTGIFDPKSNPCGYKQLPGCSYLAYPLMGHDYSVAPSLREKLMAEAFDDLRALKLLESKIGRKRVLEICEEALGGPIDYTTIPERDSLHFLRERINAEIKKSL